MAKKILVVDDEQIIVQMLSARLRANNYDVIVAYDALQAKIKAHKEMPDLIITDIMMPGGDGLNVCEILKKSDKTSTIPVVIITGFPKEEIKQKASDLGVDSENFFTKPFDGKALTDRVKKILGE